LEKGQIGLDNEFFAAALLFLNITVEND